MKDKRIAIFVENMYEDIEFWYPYFRMKEEKAQVDIIAPEKITYKGKHGMPVKAEHAINDVIPDSYDALIIPGGYSPDFMRRNKEMVKFVKNMHDQKSIVAAICHGPWMFASSNILRDKKLTSFHSIKDDLINAGAEWVDKEVVVDDNIITSRNPHDLPAFCQKIIELVKKRR